MYWFKPEICFDLRSSNCIKFLSTSSWPLIAKPCLRRYCNNVIISICLQSCWSFLCWLSSCTSTFACLRKSNFSAASLWRLDFVCCSNRSRAFFQLSNPMIINARSPCLSFRRPCLMQYRCVAQYAFRLVVHCTSHEQFFNQSAQNCLLQDAFICHLIDFKYVLVALCSTFCTALSTELCQRWFTICSCTHS